MVSDKHKKSHKRKYQSDESDDDSADTGKTGIQRLGQAVPYRALITGLMCRCQPTAEEEQKA